mgnify:FL=1
MIPLIRLLKGSDKQLALAKAYISEHRCFLKGKEFLHNT